VLPPPHPLAAIRSRLSLLSFFFLTLPLAEESPPVFFTQTRFWAHFGFRLSFPGPLRCTKRFFVRGSFFHPDLYCFREFYLVLLHLLGEVTWFFRLRENWFYENFAFFLHLMVRIYGHPVPPQLQFMHFSEASLARAVLLLLCPRLFGVSSPLDFYPSLVSGFFLHSPHAPRFGNFSRIFNSHLGNS